MIESTVAFISGGMRDGRLYPLTKYRCSHAVPLGGKYRLVDVPVSNCLNSGLWRIFVLSQYNSFSLNQHIKSTYRFDSFSNGYVDILAAEQTLHSNSWFEGTADAIRKVFRYPKIYDSEYILILTGEHLYEMDFRPLLSAHKESGSAITIASVPVTKEEATGLGIMKTDKRNRIIDFIEKPSASEADDWKSEVPPQMKEQGREYQASMGIYVFNRDQLSELLNDYPRAMDFGNDIIPLAIGSGMKVDRFSHTGYWAEIGSIRSYHEVSMDLTSPSPGLDLYDQHRNFYTEKYCLPAPKILGTIIQRSIIGEGSYVEARQIDHSIIGRRSRIGKAATITNSVIMGDDFFATNGRTNGRTNGQGNQEGKVRSASFSIGNHCAIENAIIDKNCRIGDHVRIRGGADLEDQEQEDYSVVDGIVVIHKGSIIPDHSTIGIPDHALSRAI